MSWSAFDNGKSIGLKGSESGRILRDEEHAGGARITLESGGLSAPFAITCGIYGWMVHTHFLETESEAKQAFDRMKESLSKILDAIPLANDPDVGSRSKAVEQSLSEFVRHFC